MAQTGTSFSMKLSKLTRRILVAVLAICLFVTTFSATSRVSAVENNLAKDTGLRITPLRSKPSQKPGSTTSGSITITNTTSAPMTVALSVERFQTIDEDYNYSFSKGEHTDWVRLTDKSVVLEPKTSKTVPYSLAVPVNAPPGGYYFAMFASTENKPSSTNFTEVKRVSSLVYLEVSGKVKKSVTLLGSDASWLLVKHNLTLATRLHNVGNTHYPSRFRIDVKGMFGWPKTSSQKEALILPSTIRRVVADVPFPSVPGAYTVTVTFAPPQGGPNETAKIKVLYTPIWFIAVLTLVLSSLAYWLIGKRRASRHYWHTKTS